MSPYGVTDSPQSSSASKRGSEDDGVIASASLEVLWLNNGVPHGPAFYEVVYTRGGWIWRTSHRYSEWLSLKERLRAEFGTRNLPDEKLFPKKEDMGAMISKLLTSCQGCREGGGPVGILEERRHGLQAYFSQILAEQRDLWDGSRDIKNFFSPGPPTSYSAALSKRRSEQLKEDKLKEAAAASATSLMASSFKSTFSSFFESTPSGTASSSSTPRPSVDAAAASTEGLKSDSTVTASPAPSMLNRFTAKMPSLRDFLFDGPPSQSSSRHGTTGSGLKLPSSSTNRAPSESGVTDPDGGVSEVGGSKHSIYE